MDFTLPEDVVAGIIKEIDGHPEEGQEPQNLRGVQSLQQ